MHAIAAVKVAPELALSESEAKGLSQAIGAVAEHYNLSIDPRTQAWANLAMVAAALYGPRAIAIYQRRRRAATH